MSFAHPQYLLFLLLLVPLRGWVRLPGRPGLTALRLGLLALAILVLAGPRLARHEPGLDIILLVDRSLSVGQAGLEQEREFVQLLGTSRRRGPDDRISLISFGAAPHLEMQDHSGPLTLSLDTTVDPAASNLNGALELALQKALPGRPTRLVVLSDGLYTGVDPRQPATLAALPPHEVCYRRVGQVRVGDVAAAGLVLPPAAPAGAGFLVRFTIYSSARKNARYALTRNGRALTEGSAELQPGLNQFVVRDLIEKPEQQEYRLQVDAEADPEPANNVCFGLLRVTAPPRVLIVSTRGDVGLLAQMLGQANIPADLRSLAGMDWSAARLAPYRVVVLENLSLLPLDPAGVQSLAEAVRHGVCALLVTGGETSFGQGGYHKSPLDPLLPVTMELRQEQRRGLLALVAALDRSGSMAMPAGGGRTKMELADLGTAEAINLLSPLDQVAVIAVDSTPHVIVPLVQADDTEQLKQAVLRIASEGGGIFIGEALRAAAAEVRKSRLPTRQILLFADAADSEEPLDSLELVKKLAAEGVGLSVVALGTPGDCDAGLLRDLARAGLGEIYFTNQAAELPQLFSQEVLRVSRRGFIKEPTATRPLADLIRLRLPLDAGGPNLAGYNLCALRPDASCALITADEYSSPIAAFWQRGQAATAALAVDLDGPYTGQLYAWKHLPALVVNLLRQLAGGITENSAATQIRLQNGWAGLRLEVEPALADQLRARNLAAQFLAPAGGESLTAPLVWETPTEAVAEIELSRPGHYLPIVDLGAAGVVRAQPVSLPYSPEFSPRPGADGDQVLAALAEATLGRRIAHVDEVFSPLVSPPATAGRDLSGWLILLFILLLLLEIAERRLGVWSWLQESRRAAARRPTDS